MKTYFTLLVLLSFTILTKVGYTQQLGIDMGAPGETGGNYGTVRVFDPAKLTDKKTSSLTYAEVEGSPFWDDNWHNAIIYFKNNGQVKLPQAKLNLHTGEVHYLSPVGIELAVENENIEKLVFINEKEKTKPLAVFATLPDYIDSKPTALFRVFNNGYLQLILLQKNLVKTSPYDPMLGKNISSFFSKKYYAIYMNGQIKPLKDLDRNSILSAIPFDAKIEPWLKQNKNKLKSENDVIDLLSYFNSIKN